MPTDGVIWVLVVDLGPDGVIWVMVVDFSLFTCQLMVLSGRRLLISLCLHAN